MILIVAWLLILMPAVNTLFVIDSLHRYLSVERHPILLIVVLTKFTIWMLGIGLGIIAARFLLAPHPVTGLSIAFGLALVVVQLLPAFIWMVLRRFEA